MGIKLSKLMKRSYVVSEGVQTDLSIQWCDEVFDSKSYSTPPRDVQQLCDPRSISKGIVRTPIMCTIHNEIMSPVKGERPPYLETNLDDVLPPYHPQDLCCHLIDINGDSSIADNYTEMKTVSCENLSRSLSKFEEDPSSSLCKIEIIDPDEIEKACGNLCVSCKSEGNVYKVLDLKESWKRGEVTTVTVPAEKMFERPDALELPFPIDSSETVEQVCQKILDELLESKDDIRVDELNDSNEELFIDGDISDIVESVKSLCISEPEPRSRCASIVTFTGNENYMSPSSSKFINSCYNQGTLANLEEQPWSSTSPLKRKPLGEVNRNIQQNRLVFGSAKLNQDIDHSPLKSKLPLLPCQGSAPPSKPHRSTWDSENTLII